MLDKFGTFSDNLCLSWILKFLLMFNLRNYEDSIIYFLLNSSSLVESHS